MGAAAAFYCSPPALKQSQVFDTGRQQHRANSTVPMRELEAELAQLAAIWQPGFSLVCLVRRENKDEMKSVLVGEASAFRAAPPKHTFIQWRHHVIMFAPPRIKTHE